MPRAGTSVLPSGNHDRPPEGGGQEAILLWNWDFFPSVVTVSRDRVRYVAVREPAIPWHIQKPGTPTPTLVPSGRGLLACRAVLPHLADRHQEDRGRDEVVMTLAFSGPAAPRAALSR
jgi:hypothetical protein